LYLTHRGCHNLRLKDILLTTYAAVPITVCIPEIYGVFLLARYPTAVCVTGRVCRRTGQAFKLILCVEGIAATLQNTKERKELT